jgi:hypothetical protein
MSRVNERSARKLGEKTVSRGCFYYRRKQRFAFKLLVLSMLQFVQSLLVDGTAYAVTWL